MSHGDGRDFDNISFLESRSACLYITQIIEENFTYLEPIIGVCLTYYKNPAAIIFYLLKKLNIFKKITHTILSFSRFYIYSPYFLKIQFISLINIKYTNLEYKQLPEIIKNMNGTGKYSIA